MTFKSHVTRGLNQLGPKHWAAEAQLEMSRRARAQKGRKRSLAERCSMSAGWRKPSITLPKINFPEDRED